MASILVHITHGPENPTRATLVFLAGDAVQLLRDAVLDARRERRALLRVRHVG